VATACGGSEPASLLAKADRLIAEGKLSDANVALKKLVQDSPQNSAARVRLAQVALANGDAQVAEEELSRVDRAALTDAVGQKTRLELDLALGRYAEVAKALSAGTSALSAGEQALLAGHAARGLKDLPTAEARYRAAAQEMPESAAPFIGLADTAVAAGDLPRGVTVIDGFLQRKPTDPDALVTRAKFYGRQGDFANAAASFAKAIANAPPSWPPAERWSAMYQQAEAHLRRNDIAAAKVVLEEMRKAVPGIAATRLLTARIALIERRYSDGIEELQRLTQGGGNDGIELLLAQAQFAAGSREQGTTTLERLVARSPQNVDAIKLLARLRLEQNRPDRALELLGGLTDAQATDADVVSLTSAARLQQGQPERATAALEQVIATDPANHGARLQLAAARLAQRDSKGALEVLEGLPKDVLVTQQARVRLLALVAEGKREEVDSLVKLLVAREPADVDGLAAALDVLRVSGRQDLARPVAERLLKVADKQPAILLRVASIAAADQDWATADDVLKKALAAAPENIDVRVAIAQVAAARGDDARSLAVLDEARRLQPAATAPQLLRAAAYVRAGDLSAANKIVDELLKAAPQDGLAAAAAGAMFVNLGRTADAVPRLGTAAEQNPTAENLFGLARAQIAANDANKARDSLVRAVAARPDWVAPTAALATLDLQAGRRDEAVQRAAAFAQRYPRNTEALLLHGEVLMGAGKTADSIATFDRAFELQPSSAAAVGQYRARAKAGQARAEQPLVNWLAKNPADLAVRALLAEAYIISGNRARSMAEYEDLLRRSDSNVLALNNLAWLYADAGNLARAEELGRRAVALAPEATAVQDTLGWILFKRDKTNEALPLLQKAAGTATEDPTIQYHYAAASARSGDRERALEVVQRALAIQVPFDQRGDAERLLAELRK
jgi:putative PEP-CTERM system TPR-repeat lipoprotein